MIIKVKPYRYRVTQTAEGQEDIIINFLSAKEVSEYLNMPMPTVAYFAKPNITNTKPRTKWANVKIENIWKLKILPQKNSDTMREYQLTGSE
jgi:hypothetical protein